MPPSGAASRARDGVDKGRARADSGFERPGLGLPGVAVHVLQSGVNPGTDIRVARHYEDVEEAPTEGETVTISMQTNTPVRSLAAARRELLERPRRTAVDETIRAGDAAWWEPYGPDCYAVHLGESTVGYIDLVGGLFIALSGARYDRAVEIAQTYELTAAVEALRVARR